MTIAVSTLRQLEGLTVVGATLIHDYAQLAFTHQVGLSIYNEWSIHPETLTFEQLVGKTVTSVKGERDSIVFHFLDDTKLVIDMHPEAYRGPEALQLNREGEPPVVWN
jgi:hypothetical protein